MPLRSMVEREEIRRYGNLSTHAITTALPEEVDFYPTWRPPACTSEGTLIDQSRGSVSCLPLGYKQCTQQE